MLNLCKTMHYFSFEESHQIPAREKDAFVKYIVLDGVKYEHGMFVPISISTTLKLFGKIVQIKCVRSKVYFKLDAYEEDVFISHYHSYVVNRKCSEDLSLNYKFLCSKEIGILTVKNILTFYCKNPVFESLLCFPTSL